MNLLFIKKLIDDQILDFDKLLKKTYLEIGLKEVEAFFIMKLNSLKQKGVTNLNPTIITKHLSLSEPEAMELLNAMMQRDYLSFEIIENIDGITSETFSLDKTICKIVSTYQAQIDKSITTPSNEQMTDEGEIAQMFETQLQRQLKPLEVEIIIKWLKEYKYDKFQIKDAFIDAVKSGKTSISYIDGILLKRSKPQNETTIKTDRKKSKILKDFLES